MTQEGLNNLSNQIIGVAIKVHKNLGPGFVERVYERALLYEFERDSVKFVTQVPVRIKYGNVNIGSQRIDIIVEDAIILELKSMSAICDAHKAQLVSYLKVTDKRLGLILNFVKSKLEIKRIVNNF